jgi:hypothetical protein
LWPLRSGPGVFVRFRAPLHATGTECLHQTPMGKPLAKEELETSANNGMQTGFQYTR